MKYVGGGAAWKSVCVLIVDPASESLSGSIPEYFVHLWRLRAEKPRLASLAKLAFVSSDGGSDHVTVSSRKRVKVPFSMKPNCVLLPVVSRTATARACCQSGASLSYVPKQLFRLWQRMRSVPLRMLNPLL